MKLKFYLPAVVFSLLIQYSSFAISETEPNGTFATANSIPQDSTVNGTIGSPDANDYFVSVPSDDGTMKVTFSCTSGSSTSDFFIYAYSKNSGFLGNKYLYNLSVGVHTDSFYVYCLAEDTVFFRVSSSGYFPYTFEYNLFPSGSTDSEPNGQLSTAQYFLQTDTVNGRIGYGNGTTDQNDYFVTVLPIYGTLKYYVTYNNTSNSTQSDFYTYIYNKSGSLIGNSYKYNQPLGVSTDSITVYCREQDTVFIQNKFIRMLQLPNSL